MLVGEELMNDEMPPLNIGEPFRLPLGLTVTKETPAASPAASGDVVTRDPYF